MNVFDLFAKISLDTSEYEKGLSNSGGILDSFSSKFTNVLKDLSAKFFEFGKECVSTGMDFDKAMSQVAATLGDKLTDENFDTLREFARETAKNTAFSATEVAEALNNMALAGYNVEQSMEMVPNVLNLASAGQLGLAKAADIVTKSQNAMGLSFEETRVMVDQMAAASSNSGTDVGQLGEAMLTIGANAKILKGGTAETITLLGTLANAAYTGAEGGTKLRNILDALSGKTDDATALLDKYNISLYDGKGKVRDINAVLTDMYKITSKMNDKEFMDFSKVVFNTRDKAAARKMIDSIGEYAGLLDSVTNSEGAAAEMARRQLDNLAGDVTLFKDAVEDVKISISDLATPYLREGVQKLTTDVGNFAGAFKANGIKGVASMFRIEMGTIKREFINPLLDFLSGDSGDVYTGAINFAGNLLTNLTDPKAWSKARDKFSGIVQQLIDGLTSQKAIDAFLDPEHGAPKIISNLIENFSGMATSFINLAGSLLDNLFTYMAKPENEEKIKGGAQDIMIAIGTGFVNIVSSIHENIVNLMSDIAVEMVGDFDADDTALQLVLKLGAAMGKKVWQSTLFGRIGSWIDDYEDMQSKQAYLNEPSIKDKTYEEVMNDPLLQKALAAREMYFIDEDEMSNEELKQWVTSDSSMSPLDWYNSLDQADKMRLSAERNGAVIPRFGTGGIVTKPTLAIVGEDGPEKITPLSQDSGAAIEIRFGDIYVSGAQDAGNEVIRNIDEALRIWQIQQRRGIGGVSW